MNVAVATNDGLTIDTHFGHAREFWIYDLNDETATFLERRDIEQYCVAGQSMDSALGGILKAVADCQAVLVAMIGEPPRAKLAAMGVQAVSEYANEPIEAALRDYARRQAGD
ncbi:NifB/NifX family molybdenum-iron cluster-binding protein [Rhabdochromatium marinum]|uniref:NifB/NifX family molybdenum-iron cluster-binding protein n=1 Tax=Rhabdochromatium marinum TaxID=48729 RepID=UPI0019032DDC|nr:NifB/NifX family molybdenum-iron cluster-binding protein [Rhabdochromatium marinum]MBK1650188.1 dinitrogenase iron-molybdenum cofactor biosynthesis protein [Rhabdochromatium marinum]